MLGHLLVELHEPVGYLGGVLVTDDHGLPVEFRHTLPVRPTKLQRALYGDALDRYLRTVVITRRLLTGLEHPPPLVLVGEAVLVVEAEPPLAFLAEGGAEPIGAPGSVRPLDGAQQGFLLQVRSGQAPLRVVTAAAPHAFPDLARVLQRAAETMDMTEPMARVRAGLRLIAAGDVSEIAA